MRPPGIEPGPPAWKADILPLNYRRLHDITDRSDLQMEIYDI